MPRPKSIVWKFFKKIEDDNKHISYKCNYCKELYVSNAIRQTKHAKKTWKKNA